MVCGVSTACLYPQNTVTALQQLQQAGIQTAELFLNTFSELEEGFISGLQQQLRRGDTRLLALHPFSSGMETFFFASAYEGRFLDGLELYKKYFDICARLQIPRLVFHGDYKQTPFPFEKHCEYIARLAQQAQRQGVQLCQENVVRCKCGYVPYVQKLRKYTDDTVYFALDLKQLRRAQEPLEDMLDAMQGKISYLHLSDFNDTQDCMLPGTGKFQFADFFSTLQKQRFNGDMVIELYRHNYQTVQQLAEAQKYIQRLITIQ